MVAIGLVLVVLCLLLGGGIVLSNDAPVADASAFGVSLDNVSIGGLFLTGVAVGVVAMVGLGLMLVGASRRRAKRVALKRQVRGVTGEKESLADENARLQAELEAQRTSTARPGEARSADDAYPAAGRTGDGRPDNARPTSPRSQGAGPVNGGTGAGSTDGRSTVIGDGRS